MKLELYMGKKQISALRRHELIVAAYKVMQTSGITGTTLLNVAKEIDSSKGIVLHYFKNKDDLIEHTMRYANAVLRQDVVALLQSAKTPKERLEAIIKGNFSEESFRPEIAHAWLSFCAEVPRNKQYSRLQAVIHARMKSNLMFSLKEITSRKKAEEIAFGVTTMIDGIWLRCGLQHGGIERNFAIQKTQGYLEKMLK